MDEEDGDWLDDEFSIGGKVKINLEDLNTSGWKQDLEHDYGIAKNLLEEMRRITPEYDSKLNDLKNVIKNKVAHPINNANKKIIIFSAFADTANYLYENIAVGLKKN